MLDDAAISGWCARRAAPHQVVAAPRARSPPRGPVPGTDIASYGAVGRKA